LNGWEVGIDVALTGNAPHHQRSCAHEARPQSPNSLAEASNCLSRALEKILVKDEAGLYGSDGSIATPNEEITVIEALSDRILNDLVVAMIFALMKEGAFPASAMRELGTRKQLNTLGSAGWE
jgi:hypothetical protein